MILFKPGDMVRHNNLGLTGMVKSIKAGGNLEVDFGKEGFKVIGAAHTHLLTLVDAETAPHLQCKLLPGMREMHKDDLYYRNYWDGCWEFSYKKALRERNRKDGSVIREWYEKYHGAGLFDEDDLKLAANEQLDNHFHEWQAAVLLYEKYGYLSLVEKFECASHPRKHALLRQLAGDQFADFARGRKMLDERGNEKSDSRQCPDLLVYRPDLSEWFFCEVKAGEKITDSQETFFPIVRAKTGKPIYLLVFS